LEGLTRNRAGRLEPVIAMAATGEGARHGHNVHIGIKNDAE